MLTIIKFFYKIITLIGINFSFKKKRFTIIELLVAIALLSIIVTQGLYLLTSQTKQAAKCQKMMTKFLKKQEALLVLEGLFFHLNTQDPACLKANDKIYLHFDNHIQKDPSYSGFQKAFLKVDQGRLILEFEDKDKILVIVEAVEDYSVGFYSQTTNWVTNWQSSSEGLPEMIHLKLKTKDYDIDQKFLCPFKQGPVIL